MIIIIIIIICYLKPYNYVQTNDYWWVEIVTWSFIIVYKSFVFDRNTRSHTTVCKGL